MDKLLIDICSKIVTDHTRCETLQNSVVGGEPSEADARVIYDLSSGIRAGIVFAAKKAATTLADCHAKARVVAAIDCEYVALSLAADLLAVLNDDGSLQSGSGLTGTSLEHDIL